MLVLILFLQPGHDSGIGQRRRVSEGLALSDVAQQPTHDFARARLRQIRREDHVVGPGDGPDFLDDMILQFGNETLASLCALAKCDERGHGLPLDLVGLPTTAASATRG